MAKKAIKVPIKSQLYDRLAVSVKGLDWFISGMIVLLVVVFLLGLAMR